MPCAVMAVTVALHSAYGSAICDRGGCSPAITFINGRGPSIKAWHSLGKLTSPHPVTT